MSYFTDEGLASIKAKARAEAMRTDSLWSFMHSMLIDWVEYQDGKSVRGHDGFFRIKEVDVNSGAEYFEVALEERAAFQRERAEGQNSA